MCNVLWNANGPGSAAGKLFPATPPPPTVHVALITHSVDVSESLKGQADEELPAKAVGAGPTNVRPTTSQATASRFGNRYFKRSPRRGDARQPCTGNDRDRPLEKKGYASRA